MDFGIGMEYKLTKEGNNFEPFSIVYHNDKNGRIYLKVFIPNYIEENIPAILSLGKRAHPGNRRHRYRAGISPPTGAGHGRRGGRSQS